MNILSVAGSPYEDREGQVLNLHVALEEDEVVRLGETIRIEMMDDSFLEAEVKIISPKLAGDYACVCRKIADEVRAGTCAKSKDTVTKAVGPCVTNFVVTDVPYHEVKTDGEIEARKRAEEHRKMICLTPYKELQTGDESIHDHVRDGYSVFRRVITYLRIAPAYCVAPGIYEHPFRPEKELRGPCLYTDGTYYWDSDAWKYAVKYHVALPQAFIDHVMSPEGTALFEQFLEQSDNEPDAIEAWRENPDALTDAEKAELESF